MLIIERKHTKKDVMYIKVVVTISFVKSRLICYIRLELL